MDLSKSINFLLKNAGPVIQCGLSMKLYDEARTFDADEYIALLDTLSDHRSLPESDRAALYAGVKEAILKHGGRHKVDYVFQLYMGRKL